MAVPLKNILGLRLSSASEQPSNLPEKPLRVSEKCYGTYCNHYSLKKLINNEYLQFGLGAYCFYVLLELFSPTTKYLCNRHKKGLFEKMESFFKTKPLFTLKCECYHTETYTVTVTDDEGNEKEEERSRTVVTYRETYQIPFYCCRDVSGLFRLNIDAKKLRKKALLN